VKEAISHLQYHNLCCRWLAHWITVKHKRARIKWLHAAESHCCLLNVVTGNESQFHHFNPKTTQQSMGRHHITSPENKNERTVPWASKVKGTFF
jgi:hypothetical protein